MEHHDNEIEESVNAGEARSTKRVIRKISSIALDVVLYAFLVLCVVFMILSFATKKNGGAANIFGYEFRIVVSSSMEKSEFSEDVSQYDIKDIKVKSMVFIKRVPDDEEGAKAFYQSLQVGDVLTFCYVVSSTQETITHRIKSITETETGYIIVLQGDNRTEGATVSTQTIYTSAQDYPDQNAMFNYVIGKVVAKSTALGYFVYAISQPVGLALIVIVPCTIIIIWQIARVLLLLSGERKKKVEGKLAEAERLAAEQSEERERQSRELEELKRRFAELEKKQDGEHGNEE